jgi:hypothetical protein
MKGSRRLCSNRNDTNADPRGTNRSLSKVGGYAWWRLRVEPCAC